MISPENFNALKLELEKYTADKVSAAATYEALVETLAVFINHLITNDFHRLISLLYRLDIPEEKLRDHLDQHKEMQAAQLIAHLVIERQLQKIEARKSSPKDENIADEDRW